MADPTTPGPDLSDLFAEQLARKAKGNVADTVASGGNPGEKPPVPFQSPGLPSISPQKSLEMSRTLSSERQADAQKRFDSTVPPTEPSRTSPALSSATPFQVPPEVPTTPKTPAGDQVVSDVGNSVVPGENVDIPGVNVPMVEPVVPRIDIPTTMITERDVKDTLAKEAVKDPGYLPDTYGEVVGSDEFWRDSAKDAFEWVITGVNLGGVYGPLLSAGTSAAEWATGSEFPVARKVSQSMIEAAQPDARRKREVMEATNLTPEQEKARRIGTLVAKWQSKDLTREEFLELEAYDLALKNQLGLPAGFSMFYEGGASRGGFSRQRAYDKLLQVTSENIARANPNMNGDQILAEAREKVDYKFAEAAMDPAGPYYSAPWSSTVEPPIFPGLAEAAREERQDVRATREAYQDSFHVFLGHQLGMNPAESKRLFSPAQLPVDLVSGVTTEAPLLAIETMSAFAAGMFPQIRTHRVGEGGPTGSFGLTVESWGAWVSRSLDFMNPIAASVKTGESPGSPASMLYLREGGNVFEIGPEIYAQTVAPVENAKLRAMWAATDFLPDSVKSPVRQAALTANSPTMGFTVKTAFGSSGLPLWYRNPDVLLEDSPPEAEKLAFSATLTGLLVAAPAVVLTPDAGTVFVSGTKRVLEKGFKAAREVSPVVAKLMDDASEWLVGDPGRATMERVINNLSGREITDFDIQQASKELAKSPGIARRVMQLWHHNQFVAASGIGARARDISPSGASKDITRAVGKMAEAETRVNLELASAAVEERNAWDEASKFSISRMPESKTAVSETTDFYRTAPDGTRVAVPKSAVERAIDYSEALASDTLPIIKSRDLKELAATLGVVDTAEMTATDLVQAMEEAMVLFRKPAKVGGMTEAEVRAVYGLLRKKKKPVPGEDPGAKAAAIMAAGKRHLKGIDVSGLPVEEVQNLLWRKLVGVELTLSTPEAPGATILGSAFVDPTTGKIPSGLGFIAQGENKYLAIPESVVNQLNQVFQEGIKTSVDIRALASNLGLPARSRAVAFQSIKNLFDRGLIVSNPGEQIEKALVAAVQERYWRHLAETESTYLLAVQRSNNPQQTEVEIPKGSVDGLKAKIEKVNEKISSVYSEYMETSVAHVQRFRDLPNKRQNITNGVAFQNTTVSGLWDIIDYMLTADVPPEDQFVSDAIKVAGSETFKGWMAPFTELSDLISQLDESLEVFYPDGMFTKKYLGIIAPPKPPKKVDADGVPIPTPKVKTPRASKKDPKKGTYSFSVFQQLTNTLMREIADREEAMTAILDKADFIRGTHTFSSSEELQAFNTYVYHAVYVHKDASRLLDMMLQAISLGYRKKKSWRPAEFRKTSRRVLEKIRESRGVIGTLGREVISGQKKKARAVSLDLAQEYTAAFKNRRRSSELLSQLGDLYQEEGNLHSALTIRGYLDKAKEAAKAVDEATKGMSKATAKAVAASRRRQRLEAQSAVARRASAFVRDRGPSFVRALQTALDTHKTTMEIRGLERSEHAIGLASRRGADGRMVIDPTALTTILAKEYGFNKFAIRSWIDDPASKSTILWRMFHWNGKKARPAHLNPRNLARLTKEIDQFRAFMAAAEVADPHRILANAGNLENQQTNIRNGKGGIPGAIKAVKSMFDTDNVNFGQAAPEIHTVLKSALARLGLYSQDLRDIVLQFGTEYSRVVDAYITSSDPVRVNVGGRLMSGTNFGQRVVNFLTTRPGMVSTTGNIVTPPWQFAKSYLQYNTEHAHGNKVISLLARSMVSDSEIANIATELFTTIEGGPLASPTFKHTVTGAPTKTLYAFLKDGNFSYDGLKAHLINLAEHVTGGTTTHREFKSTIIFAEGVLHAAAMGAFITDLVTTYRKFITPDMTADINRILTLAEGQEEIGKRALDRDVPKVDNLDIDDSMIESSGGAPALPPGLAEGWQSTKVEGSTFQKIYDMERALAGLNVFGMGASGGTTDFSAGVGGRIRKTYDFISVFNSTGGTAVPRAWLDEVPVPDLIKTGQISSPKTRTAAGIEITQAAAKWAYLMMMTTPFFMRPRHLSGIIVGDFGGMGMVGGHGLGAKVTFSNIPATIPVVGVALQRWMGLAERGGNPRLPPEALVTVNPIIQAVRDGDYTTVRLGDLELTREEFTKEMVDAGVYETMIGVEMGKIIDSTLEAIVEKKQINTLFGSAKAVLFYIRKRAQQVAAMSSELSLRQRIGFYAEARASGRTAKESAALLKDALGDYAHGVPRTLTSTAAWGYMLFARYKYLSQKQALLALVEPFTKKEDLTRYWGSGGGKFSRLVDAYNLTTFMPEIVADMFSPEDQADVILIEDRDERLRHPSYLNDSFAGNIPGSKSDRANWRFQAGGNATTGYNVEQLTFSPFQNVESVDFAVRSIANAAIVAEALLTFEGLDGTGQAGTDLLDDGLEFFAGPFTDILRAYQDGESGQEVNIKPSEAMLLRNLLGPESVWYDSQGRLSTNKGNKAFYAVFAANWAAGGSSQFVDDYLSQPESRNMFRRGMQALVSTLGWFRVRNESTPRMKERDIKEFDALIAKWTEIENRKLNGPPILKSDITPAGARAPYGPKDPNSTQSQIEMWKLECRHEVEALVLPGVEPGRRDLARERLKSLLGVEELPDEEELINVYIRGGW